MESRRKWRGVENFPPVKKAQWGQYSPLSPSSVLAFFPAASATARWTEWAKGIVASPACGNSAGPRSFHGSLCEHMRAERARCLGMIWLSWPCGSSPAAGVWEWRSPPPPWKHTAHIDTHTLQLTSRLMFSQSMGPFIPPDYSINRRRTLEFMNLARADEFADRSVATGGCCRCCCTQSCCSGATILSPAVNELITDSHKSTQVQYNRARPFIIPVLTSSALLQ